MAQFAFVSFDIVSHAAEADQSKQAERIATLNELVSEVIEAPDADHPIWASGGVGGHIAFTTAGALVAAPRAMRALVCWSKELSVPLRIICHAGHCTEVRGADGRRQLAGDGTNLCGSLLNAAYAGAIIVTDVFADLFDKHPDSGLDFHDPRKLNLRYFPMIPVRLCSLKGITSSWEVGLQSDHHMLTQAMQRRSPWDVIYFARRLLQNDSDGFDSSTALMNVVLGVYGELVPIRSGEGISRPFLLSSLDPPSFQRFVRLAELVERRDGELI